jgi:hypothetical protein
VELGDDGELLARVDGLALAVEVGVSMAEPGGVFELVSFGYYLQDRTHGFKSQPSGSQSPL